MKKPCPPAYAHGMDPADYSWDEHRYVECEEGGCGIPLVTERQNPTTGENIMATPKKNPTPAKVTGKTSAAPEAPKAVKPAKKEKEVKEEKVAKPKFAASILELVAEQDKTDEEIAEVISETFPDKPDILGSIKWYRSAYNRKAAQSGEDEYEEIVVDDKGKKIPKSQKAPVEREKKVKETSAPESSKVSPAKPVSKTSTQKPAAKKITGKKA